MIPSVLALLGDNPMQSEFACHIGLRGKFFCRVCHVIGKDAKGGREEVNDAASEDDEVASNADSTTSNSKSRRRKFVETLDQMVRRVTAFIKVCQRNIRVGCFSSVLARNTP